MFYELVTLLEFWFYKFYPKKKPVPKLCFVLVLLVGLGAAVYGAHYLLLSTPFPVYVLDKLNLRRLSLPNLVCDRCNNFSYPYIIENKNACAGQDVFLLTVVTSAHTNVEARNVMRRTWAGVHEYRGYRLKTLFMFGTHADKNLNSQTTYEQNLHGDIVQADFFDSYFTLSNKSSMAMRWVVRNCPQARYILKTDDDSFNIPQRIVDYLINVKIDKFFGGYCFTVVPDRRVSSKFHVSESTYPDQYYPTYCAGPGYILSQGAARDVVVAAPNTRYIQMEDVFITGMCRMVSGNQYTQISGMVVGRDDMTPCSMATWAKNAHNIVPGWTSMLWEKAMVAQRETDCITRNTVVYFVMIAFCLIWLRFMHSLLRFR